MLFVQFLTPSSFLPLKIQGKDAFKRSAEGRIGFLKVKDKGYFKIRNHDKKLSFLKCDCPGVSLTAGWVQYIIYKVIYIGATYVNPTRYPGSPARTGPARI
jgi:hypothetical protein